MQRKTQEYAKKCDQCQRFAPNIHQPGGVLNPLSSPWPFAQWGLDIVGPFPKAAGNKRYIIIGTDYFTKWVEAEPLANIRDMDAKKFIGKTLLRASELLTPSSRTTVFNLIVRTSGNTATSLASPTDIPLLPTPKEMGKPRP